MHGPPSMRPPVDRDRLQALTEKLGRATQTPTTVYLTGGATAVLEGWRPSTVAVDVRFEPDSDQLLRTLPQLKEELQINIELASPPDFIPELPGWQERSPLVLESGNIQVRHFDPYSQALSKIERGFTQDLEDVTSMLRERLITPERLLELYEQIEPQLYRYPAIDPAAFRSKVNAALAEWARTESIAGDTQPWRAAASAPPPGAAARRTGRCDQRRPTRAAPSTPRG
jgi:hypothetical protein